MEKKFNYDSFIDSLLPGNFALTKSMEIVKINSSGTLWYVKKFLVLYYYIILSKAILTNQYVDKVISLFDEYINSLDENVQDSAKLFFYPADERFSFKSNKFIKFMQFANETVFANEDEKKDYFNRAKEIYFMMLMGIGGQTAVKKRLLENVKNVNYTNKNMQTIILDAVVDSIFENANKKKDELYNGDSLRIISEKAAVEIKQLVSNNKIKNKQNVYDVIEKYPCSKKYPGKYGKKKKKILVNPDYYGVEHDSAGPLRNERQILFYFGFFHSKSGGVYDEFSTITPVGALALKANALELQAIWEHQKVKMISQTPNVTIKGAAVEKSDKFAISYTPYTDIIGNVLRNEQLTAEVYKYIVSRRKHVISETEWIAKEKSIIDKIDDIKIEIERFSRDRDKKPEESRKELLKYLLGIIDNLPKDKKTNKLGMCSLSKGVKLTSKNNMQFLYDIYSIINEYKINRYGDLFKRCEDDLKRRYKEGTIKSPKSVDPEVKIDWDIYNVRIDKFIMNAIMITSAAIICDIQDINSLTIDDLNKIRNYIQTNYNNIVEEFNIKSDNKLKIMINETLESMKNLNFDHFISRENEESLILEDYKLESSEDLFKKIKEISSKGNNGGDNERNSILIENIRKYYIKVYSNDDSLKCECCGNKTFITDKNRPYLEFHHIIPFKDGLGPDHYLNLVGLCPNCHRKIHHIRKNERKNLISGVDKFNYLNIAVVERLKQLNEEEILRSENLEYLLSRQFITKNQYDEVASRR